MAHTKTPSLPAGGKLVFLFALAVFVPALALAQEASPNTAFSVNIGPAGGACPKEMEWKPALVLEKALRSVPGCKVKLIAKNGLAMEGRKVLVSIVQANQSCEIVDLTADGVVHEPEGDIIPVLPPDGLVVHWDKSFELGQKFFDAIKTDFASTSGNRLPADVAKNVILIEAGVGYPWKPNCK
jgi:hypothetical protein